MTHDFTVVVPTRGDSKHLRVALRSALDCGESLELLVAHDRRPDEPALPPAIADDPRVRVLDVSGEGPSAARNAGLREATGWYVAFLDDDDVWLPRHLARAAEVLDRHPAAVLVASDAWIFEDSSPEPEEIPRDPAALPRFRPGEVERTLGLHDLLVENPILTPTVLLRRDRLGSEDVFDESLRVMEDYDLWLRLVRRHPIVFDPEPTVVVRRRAGSASRDLRGIAEGSLRVLDRALAAGGNGADLGSKESRVRLGRLWHDLAYACLVEGDVPSARRALAESVERLPLLGKNYIYFLSSFLPEAARLAVFARGRAAVKKK